MIMTETGWLCETCRAQNRCDQAECPVCGSKAPPELAAVLKETPIPKTTELPRDPAEERKQANDVWTEILARRKKQAGEIPLPEEKKKDEAAAKAKPSTDGAKSETVRTEIKPDPVKTKEEEREKALRTEEEERRKRAMRSVRLKTRLSRRRVQTILVGGAFILGIGYAVYLWVWVQLAGENPQRLMPGLGRAFTLTAEMLPSVWEQFTAAFGQFSIDWFAVRLHDLWIALTGFLLKGEMQWQTLFLQVLFTVLWILRMCLRKSRGVIQEALGEKRITATPLLWEAPVLILISATLIAGWFPVTGMWMRQVQNMALMTFLGAYVYLLILVIRMICVPRHVKGREILATFLFTLLQAAVIYGLE